VSQYDPESGVLTAAPRLLYCPNRTVIRRPAVDHHEVPQDLTDQCGRIVRRHAPRYPRLAVRSIGSLCQHEGLTNPGDMGPMSVASGRLWP
jgi:hypothetical protein